MSDPASARRAPAEPDDPAAVPSLGSAGTAVPAGESSAPSAAAAPPLHPELQAQLRAIRSRTGSDTPDVQLLLQIVSAHYGTLDEERRGIVHSMRLMAEEAHALAHEAREQSSEHLQVILDHVLDAVLTVDALGLIQTFNPTGQRLFGYAESELIGQRIDLLVPPLAEHGDVAQELERLASVRAGHAQAGSGSREIWCRRKDGTALPAEIAVSAARIGQRAVYVVCLRDQTERRASEQAIRESEARFRTLVDHAPEAIVVIDVDARHFVDVNENAERFFGMTRDRLCEVGPAELSPPVQPDGNPSALGFRYLERAAEGTPQVFEWTHRDAQGKDVACEVRLVRLPSSARRLVRGSILDISERKRAERIAAAEREVFGKLTGDAPLPEVLEAVTRLIESLGVGTLCSISVLAPDAESFAYVVAPRFAERGGAALEAGLHAAWSTPIKAASGRVLGVLRVYRDEPGLPGARESELMAHAAQLAGLAIERRLAEEALRSSESRFRGLFESIAEGVYQSTREGRMLSVNPAFVAMLGFTSAQEMYALPSTAMLYWNPADRSEFVRRVDAEGEVRGVEFTLRRRDGQQITVVENARALRDGSGRIVGYEGTITDITARKHAEQAVFAEKERAQVTLQSIGDAVISTDAEGRIEYLNPVAERLTGWTADEALGRPIGEVLNLVNETTREALANPLVCAVDRAERSGPADHTVLVTRSGQEIAIQESAAPICDRQGKVIGAVIVFHDVTRERRLKRALSYQASHDALTGLMNRREFDNRLSAAVLSARRGEGCYALLYIDLDQFKVVNDTCGHPAGDRLLRDITGMLQARVRASDTIARLGGDEFGVLLENCSLDQATRIAESIRQGIRDYRFVWGASTLSVGASIGLVEITRGTDNVAGVMSAADIACYAAKDSGRNRVHVYEVGGASPHHREMHWVARVTRAAEQNGLELFFQPIVAIGKHAVPAFHELTVKLRNEEGKLVPPSEFIPAAERYNVMSSIDRWVVLQAIELLREHGRRSLRPPLLAVNLSGSSLNEQWFVEFVLQQTADPAIAGSLCFEITETAAVTNLSHAIYFMRELRARGCKFSLDDFGSGLSSFMYLKTLPVDYLKIDGQFIGQIAHDPVDRSMVEAISKVGAALGICTVAECVENEAVLAELRRIGVDFAQGYHLARPAPIAGLLAG